MPVRPSSAAAERAHRRASNAARRAVRAAAPAMATILAPVVAALGGASSYAEARRALLKAAHRPTPPALASAIERLLTASHREGEASARGDG